MSQEPLKGIGVLVTRPRAQAQLLCELIEQAGGEAISFPVLEIQPMPDYAQADAALTGLNDADWVIFVSANAVHWGLDRIRKRIGGFPQGVKLAAIGKATARVLRESGLEPDAVPVQGYNSEALLSLPDFQQVTGAKVYIMRGRGGRELLAKTLRDRGAAVAYIELYQRVKPDVDVGPVLDRWRSGEVDIVTVSSQQVLHNLVEMLGAPALPMLYQTPLVAISETVLKLADTLGFQGPLLLAERPSDQDLVDAVVRWAKQTSWESHD